VAGQNYIKWPLRATLAINLLFEDPRRERHVGHLLAVMAAARSLARAETLVQYEAYERAFNKLARTFAAQVEALKRYRSSGSQKVTVEHININDGGRAIVGTVALAPRGGQIYDEPPHAKQISYELEPTMWSADPPRDAVPVASDAERPLPDARRRVARRS